MLPTRNAVIEVVESYVHGLGNKDFSSVPFAPDVTYESPLSPKIAGQAVIDFLSSLFPVIRGVKIKQHIVEGEYCATVFDLDTIYGEIPIFDRFRVVAGQLQSINPYYDPGPIKNAQVAARRAQLQAVADAYFAALARKDFSAIPYDDNIVLRAPLAPGGVHTPLVGKEALRTIWWPPLVPALGKVTVLEQYINEATSAICTEALIEVVNPPATLRVADRFTVNAEGKIIEQENHFDPRDVTNPGWQKS